jgi:hypothetical protein
MYWIYLRKLLSVQQTGSAVLQNGEQSVKWLQMSKDADEPRVAPSTNDCDGRAGNPNEDIEVLEDDAQEAENLGGTCAVSLLDAVAALDGASVALTGRGGPTSRCGDRKSSESEGGEELELHC